MVEQTKFVWGERKIKDMPEYIFFKDDQRPKQSKQTNRMNAIKNR